MYLMPLPMELREPFDEYDATVDDYMQQDVLWIVQAFMQYDYSVDPITALHLWWQRSRAYDASWLSFPKEYNAKWIFDEINEHCFDGKLPFVYPDYADEYPSTFWTNEALNAKRNGN